MRQFISLVLPLVVWAGLTACQPVLAPAVDESTPFQPRLPTATPVMIELTETAGTTPTERATAVSTVTHTPAEPTATATPPGLPTPDRPLPERVPDTPAPETGEAPAEVVAQVIDAARVHLGLSADAPVTVVRAETVTWSDGSLGCAGPGGVYTQAEVQGYWIVVEADGITLDYRVPVTGPPVLCARRLP